MTSVCTCYVEGHVYYVVPALPLLHKLYGETCYDWSNSLVRCLL